MQFDFSTSQRILFGAGKLAELGNIAAGFGKHALIVTGTSQTNANRVLGLLAEKNIQGTVFSVTSEPSVPRVRAGVQMAVEAGCDFVIGIGGGSAMDTGKAISALIGNGGDIYDFIEVVGKGLPITKPSLPHIAIPTTAGTGTEVTRNAVIASPEHGVKASLRSVTMLPTVALVDPELTYDLPASVTASTGMDALAQVIEPFVSIRANPFVDLFCREGMARGGRSLHRAYENGMDREARLNMAFTSLMGGLALANAGLGAVHGFAAPIGGSFPAPHGAVCAILLPPVVEVNLRALGKRAPGDRAVGCYDEAAQLLIGDPKASAQDGVVWLADLCKALKIPRLSAYGITPNHIPDLVGKAQAASSMKANPIRLLPEELQEILEMAL